MFCDKCGKQVKDTMAFCPYCGNKFQEITLKKEEVVEEKEKEREIQEATKIKKEKFVWTKLHKRIALGFAISFAIIVLGAGVFKGIQKFGNQENKMENHTQMQTEGKNGERKTKVLSASQEEWKLFQKDEKDFVLNEQEIQWSETVLANIFETNYKAEYEENLTSFMVLRNAKKDKSMVTINVVKKNHPFGFQEYVESVEYLKLQFLCEKEPKIDEIQVSVATEPKNAFTKVSASGHLKEQKNASSEKKEMCYYYPKNVVDKDATTTWIEGKNGYGKGEWICVSAKKKHLVYGFAIKNGFTKTLRTMERNAQVKKVILTFSDGKKKSYTLNENVYISDKKKWYSDYIFFDEPVDTSKVKFTIEAVYQGKKYYQYVGESGEYPRKLDEKEACADTCISEIKILELPDEEKYQKVNVTEDTEKTEVYHSWKEAYNEALSSPEKIIDTYKKNMSIYMDEYPLFTVCNYTVEKRYEQDRTPYVPDSGFLYDMNQDGIPELFLTGDSGNAGERIVHVFTYVEKEKELKFCGSFVEKYDDESGETEENCYYENTEDGTLAASMFLAEVYDEAQIIYFNFSLKNNKLVQDNKIELLSTVNKEWSSQRVTYYRENDKTITKKRYDMACEEYKDSLRGIETLSLSALKDEVQ